MLTDRDPFVLFDIQHWPPLIDTIYTPTFITPQRYELLQYTNTIGADSFGALYRIGYENE